MRHGLRAPALGWTTAAVATVRMASRQHPAMSNLIRSLSSLMSGRTDALPGVSAPEASPGAGSGPPTSTTAATLPMVAAYAVTPEEMAASSRLRRSRSVSLLRSSGGALSTTSRVAPTLPSHTPRAGSAPTSRPCLTQTERVRLQVMQAQIQLASLRLYDGPIDGVLSAATVTAVRYFQTLKGLRPSGTLAAGTLSALGVPVLD
jgi:Putative peptidoglycan binding domain